MTSTIEPVTPPGTPFDLHGRVAVVTGGNTGIGLGIATGLAAAGASVAIWARNAERSEAAVATLASSGTDALSVICDVSDESAVDRAVEETLERFGRIDACFANAGTGGARTRFTELTLDAWHDVLGVNLDGVFLTFRGVACHMVERGEGGSLVATASLTAVEAAPNFSHYAASKAAVVGLTRTLAVELARAGIRVNALMPGWIETELNREFLQSDAAKTHVLPRVPARRFGTPQDLAAAAVYLASPGSAYHTGDVLVLDGAYRLF